MPTCNNHGSVTTQGRHNKHPLSCHPEDVTAKDPADTKLGVAVFPMNFPPSTPTGVALDGIRRTIEGTPLLPGTRALGALRQGYDSGGAHPA